MPITLQEAGIDRIVRVLIGTVEILNATGAARELTPQKVLDKELCICVATDFSDGNLRLGVAIDFFGTPRALLTPIGMIGLGNDHYSAPDYNRDALTALMREYGATLTDNAVDLSRYQTQLVVFGNDSEGQPLAEIAGVKKMGQMLLTGPERHWTLAINPRSEHLIQDTAGILRGTKDTAITQPQEILAGLDEKGDWSEGYLTPFHALKASCQRMARQAVPA